MRALVLCSLFCPLVSAVAACDVPPQTFPVPDSSGSPPAPHGDHAPGDPPVAEEQPVGPNIDPEQLRAFQQLERDTGEAWTVRWRDDLGTPALLEGRTRPLIADASAAKAVTLRFFKDHAALYQLRDADDELAPAAPATDALGMVHVRLRQMQRGIPVWGHGLGAHFAADGALVRVEGSFAPLPPLAHTTPVVSSIDARAAATAAMGPVAPPGKLDVDAPKLVIDVVTDPSDGGLRGRLAWRTEGRLLSAATPGRRAAFVDADTGETYRVDELLDELRGSGTGALGQRREFEITQSGYRYTLEDETAGTPAQKVYSAGYGSSLPGSALTSDDPEVWDEAPLGAGAAVDAQANLALVESYFARVHGRRGALDRGAGMRATVHFGLGYTGSFWNGQQLVFGDGDGVRLRPLSAALDVVAHEYAHAVTESAADLGHAGEPGALNEAVADVFACFVEQDAASQSAGAGLGRAANWVVGEDATLDGAGMRDLADPHRTGNPARLDERDAYGGDSDDRGGVHRGSTIASHAAWLMTEGGTEAGLHVAGIGRAAAEHIWYRALTRYLGPWSGFLDAAEATLTAARDLYGAGSSQEAAARDAWRAAGVL